MRIYGHELGVDPPLLVADCWSTSEGNRDTARALIEAVAPYVDVIKMTGYSEHRFCLTAWELRTLTLTASLHGVGFMLTPVELNWVAFAAKHGEAIKIASGDLLHRELVEAAAVTGKPVILSTGWATDDEVRQVLDWLGEFTYHPETPRSILLHTVSAYPTPVEQANVRAVRQFWSEPEYLGYSNHVPAQEGGFEACCAAVAHTAVVVEVHATLDRSESACARFHDHQVSFLPEELADLRQRLDRTHACLGSGVKEPQQCEIDNLASRRYS